MKLSRRSLLKASVGATALIALGSTHAFASKADEAVQSLTGGAAIGEGAIELTAPEIAENGNTVPIEVTAPGAVSVTILADGNPVPNVATFNFGKLNPTRSASTRIRLSQTQNVIALAKMEDGSFQMAKANIKVTIGGCGG